jgi:hypothetical protein
MDFDYQESVILQKTSLKDLILIIKSAYQGWYHSLDPKPITMGGFGWKFWWVLGNISFWTVVLLTVILYNLPWTYRWWTLWYREIFPGRDTLGCTGDWNIFITSLDHLKITSVVSVEKLVRTHTNLVLRESLDDTLCDLLPWDIEFVIDEPVDEKKRNRTLKCGLLLLKPTWSVESQDTCMLL